MKKELFTAIFILTSISIGAGVLALPYVFSQAGFLTATLMLVFMTLILLLLYLYLGEIVLRTKGRHHLAGLAEKYLGKKGKHLMFLFNSLGIYGALLAYTIGAGYALNAIYPWNQNYYSIIYFLIMSIILYYGKKIFEKTETFLSASKIIFMAIIGIILIPKINFDKIIVFDITKLHVPYGAILFSLLAISAIPMMGEELRNKNNLKASITYGMLLTFLIYMIFVTGMVGTSAAKEELSTTGVRGVIGLLANLFAVFAMSTAFIALGYAQKQIYMYDYLFKKFNAWTLTLIIPLALFLLDFRNFITVVEVTGSVAGGLVLLLVLIMHSRSKKLGNREPEYEIQDNIFVKSLLFLIFAIGIILLFL